jgi:uncharacterized membrane protein YbaN (DUF454 family)
MKKYMWMAAGFVCLAMVYVGLVVPGIPFSIFLVGAAYCFSKSSDRMHNWIYSHKIFGPFLTNWSEKRIFPTKMKYMMVAMMSTTVLATWLLTASINITIYSSLAMIAVALWAWRYPGSLEEYERKINNGKTNDKR